MRKAWLLLLLAPSALVYACSGDSSTTDGGTDATANDAAPDVAKDTGTQDTGTQDTGVQDSGGGDVSFNITCLKPANCIDGGDQDAAYPPDSGEVCCGTVQTSGTFPSCSFDQASTACAGPSTCPTTIGTSSCGTDKVRLCESDTECTENTGNPLSSYTKCCSTAFGDAGMRVHFCGNTTIASISGGKITCP
jgi:hypothetical protein